MILGEVGSQIAVDLQAQGEDAVRLEISQGKYHISRKRNILPEILF
jgi:hypothetical protein